ncbi:hypothetical protein CP8484711_1415A, partial [Chlamydia psittaci 84-8471/1]
YFGELLNYRLKKSRSFAWDSLIAAICALYPGELFYPISKAFNAGLVDITFISMEDVINIINEETIESCLQQLLSSPELIND